MSGMYNAVGAPGEFYPLASIAKRQLIYYLYMSKIIYLLMWSHVDLDRRI